MLRAPGFVRHPTDPFRWIFSALFLAVALAQSSRASNVEWKPVSADELAGQTPVLSADAPAEVTFWTIDVDDRDYPEERRIHEYIRYRILDPERATEVTRLSALTVSSNGEELNDVEIHARLTLPDGTSTEFGKESIQERSVQKTGAEQTWIGRLFGSQGTSVGEKFLAISGIEAGAVLEYQIVNIEHPPRTFFARTLQKINIPVRQVTYTHRLTSDYEFIPRATMLNRGNANATFDFDRKKSMVIATGHDLPALVNEPFSVPPFDRSATIFGGYSRRNVAIISHQTNHQVRVDAKAGPWAGYATLYSMVELDAVQPTKRLDRLASQITAGAVSDEDKARRIHDYVHDLYLRFRRAGRVNRTAARAFSSAPLDEVVNFDKNPDVRITALDFVWLAVALDKASGLDAQVILLPNRSTVSFNPKILVEPLLGDECLRVNVGGNWMFSQPASAAAVPFGALPWYFRGEVGLVVQEAKQEFIDIPESAPEESAIVNSGSFQLDPEGTLSGPGRRTLTGDPAIVLRASLRTANEERRREILVNSLKSDFGTADVTLTGYSGADDLEGPVSLDYRLQWPGFAELTKSRLIFRPSVVHGLSASPFAPETRTNAIEFPYAWIERDDLTLQLPAGYRLEAPSAPRSMPGDRLGYRITLTYRPTKGIVGVKREFVSKLSYVPEEIYPDLKNWYDSVAQSDGHELVAIKPASPAPGAAPPAHPATAERKTPAS